MRLDSRRSRWRGHNNRTLKLTRLSWTPWIAYRNDRLRRYYEASTKAVSRRVQTGSGSASDRAAAPRSHVTYDLGGDPGTLRRWVRELAPVRGVSLNIAPAAAVSATELLQLRREDVQLRMERDMLNKAIGVFSRMPQ